MGYYLTPLSGLIAERIAGSGEKPLTRRELEREIANRRARDF
jgi:hypothetical protein